MTDGSAGWYPDPDGQRGLLRWWTGTDWADLTRSAETAPWPVDPTDPPAAASARSWQRGGLRVVVLGAGLVVAGLLVTALVVSLIWHPWTDPPGGSSGSTGSAGPTVPGGTGRPFPPGTSRIIDVDAGIAYPYLGIGWREYDLTPHPEMVGTQGQYIVTEESVPATSGIYIAECTSGLLVDDFLFGGPEDLPRLATEVRVVADVLPAPNRSRVVRSEVRTIDGVPGYVHEVTVSWDAETYEADAERVAVILIDTGRSRPSLVLLSLPNTRAELFGVIDLVLDGIDLV